MKFTRIGRNQACWCLSGKKYKKCHLNHMPIGNFILICGEPGTGKTTLRNRLHNQLGNLFYSIDYDSQLKELVDNQGEINNETFKAAQDKMISGFLVAANDCAVIADCLFSEQRLIEIKQKLIASAHKPFFLLLHCDEALRQDRISIRHSINPDAPIGSDLNGMSYNPSSIIWDAVLDSNTEVDALAEMVLTKLRTDFW